MNVRAYPSPKLLQSFVLPSNGYVRNILLYTVTRPYAGFRHPDRIVLDPVRGGEHFVPRPCWYFTFLNAGRHFRNFLDNPVKNRKSVSKKDQTHILRRMLLHNVKQHNVNVK